MSTPVDVRAPAPADPTGAREDSTPQNTTDLHHPAAASRPAPTAAPAEYARWELALAAFGVFLGTAVATIGLYSSFGALYKKAALPAARGGWGWSDPWMLPVGVDTSILAFGIVNLLLIRARRQLWWVKWVPRGGTVITIYLNWEAAATVPAQLGHAALAALWVVFSEIAAHLYAAHIGEANGVRRMGKIRLSRWFSNPATTLRIWMLMRRDEITSYEDALSHHKSWMVYRQRLAAKYQTRYWRSKATQQELAPFQLARVGLSVEEALVQPLLEEVREQQRLADAALQRAGAEIQKVDADVQIRTAQIQAEVARIQAEGELQIAKTGAERAAGAEIQKAEAAFQLAEAERQAELALVQDQAQARARELAGETERRQLQARIETEKAQALWRVEQQQMARAAADEERRLDLEREQRDAQEEADRAEAAARRARGVAEQEAERLKAEEAAVESRARAAEHAAAEVKANAEAQQAGEEVAASKAREAAALEAGAERRARAAEHEARAVEAAARTRMSQAEWDAHRVKAMIEARGESEVTIQVIADELGVSVGTAHNRKDRALDLLRTSGSRPVQPMLS